MTTFVLVHGAWHGGWCWSAVATRLRAAGHRVYTPTLTGLGERAHLFSGAINLTTHITDVVNVMDYEDLTDVVLCGHSYGGCVISGVAERAFDRIAALVFLDAFIPDDGQGMADVTSSGLNERLLRGAAQNGGVGIPPIPAAAFRTREEHCAYVDAKCVPQPIGTFLEKLTLTGARERVARKTYIRAAAYPSESFDAARARALADGWPVLDLPCGHDVMVDLPEPLAEALESVLS
jgi:pimeloyl-ACP methyl ester carboxylesterase